MSKDCTFNKGIICRNAPLCAGCGWEPSVDEFRKKQMRHDGNWFIRPVLGFDGTVHDCWALMVKK